MQRAQGREAPGVNTGVPSPDLQPAGQLPQSHSSDRRLHLRHPGVGSQGFVQPAETGRMLFIENRIIILLTP